MQHQEPVVERALVFSQVAKSRSSLPAKALELFFVLACWSCSRHVRCTYHTSALELFDMLMLRVGAIATLQVLTLCLSTYGGVCKLHTFVMRMSTFCACDYVVFERMSMFVHVITLCLRSHGLCKLLTLIVNPLLSYLTCSC
jgi:hypothetical protein